MLSGQEIGFADSLIIAVVGLSIVMTELGLLAGFVKVLSKILAPLSRKKSGEEAGSKAQAVSSSASTSDCGLNEDELSAVISAVSMETGLELEQFQIKSIDIKS